MQLPVTRRWGRRHRNRRSVGTVDSEERVRSAAVALSGLSGTGTLSQKTVTGGAAEGQAQQA